MKLVQLKKKSKLRLVQNAIHSTLVVKNSLKLADVLIASTKNTVLNKPDFQKTGKYSSCLFFSFLKINEILYKTGSKKIMAKGSTGGRSSCFHVCNETNRLDRGYLRKHVFR